MRCLLIVLMLVILQTSFCFAEENAADVHLDQNTLNDILKAMQENPPLPLAGENKKTAVQKTGIKSVPDKTSDSAPATPTDDYTRKILAQQNAKQSAVDDILGHDTSQLERAYSERARKPLKQFGYDIFSGAAERKIIAAANDDYTIGIGDTLTVTYRGARNDKMEYVVNREGQIVMEGLAPLMAAGRPFKSVSGDIQNQVKANVLNTEAYVALDKVRQIGVQVLGEVRKPGRQDLNGFSTVMDALNAAGGIRKTGSLRNVTLSRGNGWGRKIDLYHLLLTGSREMDMQLNDGDTLLIAPIGQTMAVAGDVKRAGIYELPESNPRLTLQQSLYLAGEITQPAGLKFQSSRIGAGGQEMLSGISNQSGALGDGDIVIAQRFDAGTRGAVELSGDVRSPGSYALDSVPTLQALLGDGGVAGNNAYPLMGVIERYDRKTLSTELIPFAPDAVARGDDDKALADGDKVKLLTREDVRQLAKATPEIESKRSAFGLTPPVSEEESEKSPLAQLADQQKISMRGAVNKPGPYPVSQATTLDKLIAAAGGLRADADRSAVEIVRAEKGGIKNDWRASRDVVDLDLVSPASVRVPPGAAIRINQNLQVLNTRGITIGGEVRRPGTYDLMRGEKLTSLIERAGGYTDEAYPEGVLFTRESARRREAELFRRTADELDIALSRTMSTQDKLPSEDKINAARTLVNELRNSEAVGRITVEADPSVLAIRPDLDPLLESGDRILVPKRTTNVHVAGEVFSPASLKFSADKEAAQYIQEAGGITRMADDSKSFVVLPDGSARPLYVSSWNHENNGVPPGSTIIVPRDPDPVSFLALTQSLGSIFTQLAVSSAALSSINRDR